MSNNDKLYRKSNNQPISTMSKLGGNPRIKTLTKPNQKSSKANNVVLRDNSSIKTNNISSLPNMRASTAAARTITRSTTRSLFTTTNSNKNDTYILDTVQPKNTHYYDSLRADTDSETQDTPKDF